MPKELRVFVCNHVFEKARPVLLISSEDGDLSFLCGELHNQDVAEIKAVGLNHVVDDDPSIVEALEKLPVDSEAERVAVGAPWIITSTKPN
jgi:hypothetical protein